MKVLKWGLFNSFVLLIWFVAFPYLAIADSPEDKPTPRPVPQRKDNEFLFYQIQGFKIWSYRYIELFIIEDGTTEIELVRIFTPERPEEHLKGTVKLLPEKLEQLRSLVKDADFFDLPDKDTLYATDTGDSVMRLSMNGKTRELSFRIREELLPLCRFFRSLADQYSAVYAVKEKIATTDMQDLLHSNEGQFFESGILKQQLSNQK